MGRATLFRAVLFLSLLRVVYFIDVRRCARTAFELAASASALPLCTHATHTCPRLTVTRVIVRTDRLAPRVLPQAPAAATTPAAAPIATVAAAVQPLSSAPPPSSA